MSSTLALWHAPPHQPQACRPRAQPRRRLPLSKTTEKGHASFPPSKRVLLSEPVSRTPGDRRLPHDDRPPDAQLPRRHSFRARRRGEARGRKRRRAPRKTQWAAGGGRRARMTPSRLQSRTGKCPSTPSSRRPLAHPLTQAFAISSTFTGQYRSSKPRAPPLCKRPWRGERKSLHGLMAQGPEPLRCRSFADPWKTGLGGKGDERRYSCAVPIDVRYRPPLEAGYPAAG
jgi:hypothetical protein